MVLKDQFRNIGTALFLAGSLAAGMFCQSVLAAEPVVGAEAAASETDEITYDYDELTVGSTTAFGGDFFTQMWGNSVSDLNVRTLIHGYNLIEWDGEEGAFRIDPSVVSGTVVTQNAAGDRTYTLTIYSDLFYNDGTPITSRDYAFSMLLGIAPQVSEIGGTIRNADYILGYKDYVSGKVPYLAGLRILDDHMLSITIDHAYLPFFYELALLDCTPYPISVIAPGCAVIDDGNGIQIVNEDEDEDEEEQEPLFTADLLEQTILDETDGYLSHPQLTSGPYRLLSYDGTTAEFELNPYYKGNSNGVKPTINRIIFRTADNDTMIDELGNGDFGLLNKCVSSSTLQDGMELVSHDKQFGMSNYPRSGMSFIGFCCERAGVSSEAVRQAIALCLDKDRLVEDYVGNYGLRVDGYYGIGQWMYQLLNGTLAYPTEPPEEGSGEEAQQKYEEDLQAWEALSLDNIKIYDLDTEEAVRLLEEDGWTLNRDGEAFDPEEDDVRCRKTEDDELEILELTMLYPQGNRIGESLQEAFVDHLAEAGIILHVQETEPQDLLRQYYRQDGERACDLIYLATDFDVVFDPSRNFAPEDPKEDIEQETEQNLEEDTEQDLEEDTEQASQQYSGNTLNTTGISDQELYELAVDMRRTEPGDVLAYCQKWVAFEERFAEVLPMIPVYSNVYFDFYPRVLQNYNISANVNWGSAIVEAYLGDPADLEEETEEMSEELGEGEILLD